MVSNSKILTVSYGTFSCTLEGFDNPFNTMKSIAEYFRDLAADDRYFGAEPPTPDADMLHRIAEREIQKRVEARVEDNEIVLRQADAPVSTQTAIGATVVAAETLLGAESDDIIVEDDIQEDTQSAAEPIEESAPVADPDGEIDVETPDVQSTDINSEEDDNAAVSEPVETVDEITTELSDEGDDDFMHEALGEHAPELVQDGSIADKLSRIRAVVDGNPTVEKQPFIASDEYVEDQHANNFIAQDQADDQDEDASDTRSTLLAEEPEELIEETEINATADSTEPSVEIAAEAVEEEEEPSDADDTVTDVLSRLSEQDDDVEEIEAPTEVAEDADQSVDIESDDLLKALINDTVSGTKSDDVASDIQTENEDLDRAFEADLEDSLSADIEDNAENLFVQTPEDSAEADDEADANPPATADPEKDEVVPAAEPKPTRPRRPRVIKVRHVKNKETAPQIVSTEEKRETSLTESDEADLMAELAQVEAETHGTAANAELSDEAEKDTAAPSEADGNRLTAFDDSGVGQSDEALDRILAETNTKMESTSATRRHSAIAHLKAAVQATRADKEAVADGEAVALADEKDAYRSDLARVVRPRRPERGADAAGGSRRMPPLVLVSEQRIDDPAQTPSTDADETVVRPRRVIRNAPAPVADMAAPTQMDLQAPAASQTATEDFSGYAARVEAHTTSELMEAAASYLIHCKKLQVFKRPQLMNMLRSHLGDEAFSREEGLRAFGKLLREGRIQKVERGQFSVTETTRFGPDDLSNDRQTA